MTTIRLNGETEPLVADTIAELVAAKSDMPAGRGLAVALNGTLVRRADWAKTALNTHRQPELMSLTLDHPASAADQSPALPLRCPLSIDTIFVHPSPQ